MALELDGRGYSSAAREIIATEGEGLAVQIVSARRGRPAMVEALERELRRLPTDPQNRVDTLRRWRAEARP
jgi:hypothetical protein